MRQPKQEFILTLTERQEVRAALDNGLLVSALQKIMGERVEFWAHALKDEALKAAPNSHLMVQFAGRQAEAERFEENVRKAVGL